MKRLHYFFMALSIMAVAGMFSSCNIEDTNQSMVLSGEWRGDFGMYYNYVDRYGREYTFECYDTYITFIPAYEYANYGIGKQVDYYAQGPYEYQYYRFRWSVNNGVIYLTYEYDYELDTRISDYHMTNDYLKGVFSNSGTPFRLYKIVDYYDWTPYVNIYGYSSRNNWGRYYAPATRADGEEIIADSIVTDSLVAPAPAEEGHVISRGRRTTSLKQ
ncbi:MAG: hypothetical protein IKO73_03875 [Bacteroidaceae bacterium]|nr:hypothetical protein [Bacteroidaceae bacterium]